MSYRRTRAKKNRRAKTPRQITLLIERDTRFCQRWGIAEDQAWKWDRFPDASWRRDLEWGWEAVL